MSFSAGTFSINSTGQPVVSGTTISATVFNALTADLATGLSTCMLKDGTQTATAGIGFFAGTVSLPGIYFGTDTATGFYRIGLNNNGYAVNGTKLLDMTGTTLAVTSTITANTIGVTSGTTATVFNATATTVNAFGAATTLNIGNSGGTTTALGNWGVGGTFTATGAINTDSTTDTTSTTTGSIQTDGGVGIAKALFVGTTASLTGNATVAGQLTGQSTVARFAVRSNQNSLWGVEVSTSADVGGGNFMGFVNSSNTAQGSITATNATTTAYNTSSDMRLKTDLGVAIDITVLRDTVIHDFKWNEHGGIDRGVFAQEAYLVKGQRAITHEPKKDWWGADYSKYVPDLIVGWQNHEARIAALEAQIGH